MDSLDAGSSGWLRVELVGGYARGPADEPTWHGNQRHPRRCDWADRADEDRDAARTLAFSRLIGLRAQDSICEHTRSCARARPIHNHRRANKRNRCPDRAWPVGAYAVYHPAQSNDKTINAPPYAAYTLPKSRPGAQIMLLDPLRTLANGFSGILNTQRRSSA